MFSPMTTTSSSSVLGLVGLFFLASTSTSPYCVVAFSPIQQQMLRHTNNARQHKHAVTDSHHDPAACRRTSTTTALFAKIGVFFGTSTGSTEAIADLIVEEFQNTQPFLEEEQHSIEGPFEIDELNGSIATTFAKYDALIVGTPTWNTGADVERSGTGWDEIYYGEMKDLDISGKKVAVFGLGDQSSYAENYADASGELHDVFENLGCTMIGYTSQDGYEHEASKAIRDDLFCALLCDAVNQEEMSQGRVENWIVQLQSEGILDASTSSTTVTPSSVNGAAQQQVVEVEAQQQPQPQPTIADITAMEELQKENAKLRELLEENSRIMDTVLKNEKNLQGGASNGGSGSGAGGGGGFTPHYNIMTGKTMWTSQDGRTCYYTMETPKSP